MPGGSYGSYSRNKREALKVIGWHTSTERGRVVMGPADKIHVGTVMVREYGQDVPVEIESVGRPFVRYGLSLRYGYPADRDETPGQRAP